jgi:quinohemoprotein ethanol dehydrogenase
MHRKLRFQFLVALAIAGSLLAGCSRVPRDDAKDWPGYGRTAKQQFYSPLGEITQSNVGSLGLAWSMDLESGNSVTQPIEVDGVLYFAQGLSVVHAVDAATGKLLWRYDPGAAEKAGLNLRLGWGVRGIAWWDGKIYTGTQDGRLIAIDAKSGKPVWSVQTFPHENPAYISGAPRVFDGRVIIGFGSSTGASRGYVSAYDASDGHLVWRFFTTPGDPSKGFENKAMEMAAKTWAGEWWKFGGGAHVWNAIAYDEETDTVFIGTGSPYPWNRKIRSADKGDNLFICSIVALSGKTGAYKWHYQTVPGDTWDFDATMDIELADIDIDGKPRKVIMQAPKNGFFYVIDRITGKLISAEPIAKTTWATKIDLRTGRPVEVPGARFENGKPVEIWPTSLGAHNWIPMAHSPRTGLVYIPVADTGFLYGDGPPGWKMPSDRRQDDSSNSIQLIGMPEGKTPKPVSGRLLAWSPAQQKLVWSINFPTYLNGGILATGGDLVFQGSIDGSFKAYAANNGKSLWSFDGRAPIIAPPISYEVNGRQYVTVLTGLGMAYPINAALLLGKLADNYGMDPRSEPRRVLTFAIGGKATLPPRPVAPPAATDPGFKDNAAADQRGAIAFFTHCSICHGSLAVGSGHAPDLRRSPIPVSREAFTSIVKDGVLVPRGMPNFAEFPPEKIEDLRQYIRSRAAQLRQGSVAVKPPPRGVAPGM